MEATLDKGLDDGMSVAERESDVCVATPRRLDFFGSFRAA
jgi:hypothetical protein